MRLTKRYPNGVVTTDDAQLRDIIGKLAAYEDAEEEGRLVVLPKKLYGYYEWDVTGVRYYDGKVTAYYVKNEQVESIIFEIEIGDSVFFTREEAEAAWKGGRDK